MFEIIINFLEGRIEMLEKTKKNLSVNDLHGVKSRLSRS